MGDKPKASLPDNFRLCEADFSPCLRLIALGQPETRVEPQAMVVIAALARAAPSPASRDRMLQQVWGDQVAREEVLTRCIHQLQEAPEGDSEHQHLGGRLAPRCGQAKRAIAARHGDAPFRCPERRLRRLPDQCRVRRQGFGKVRFCVRGYQGSACTPALDAEAVRFPGNRIAWPVCAAGSAHAGEPSCTRGPVQPATSGGGGDSLIN